MCNEIGLETHGRKLPERWRVMDVDARHCGRRGESEFAARNVSAVERKMPVTHGHVLV